MQKVVTAILGGGQGSRLAPLTRYRAKPAVPVAGKFRLIDIPISNSLHAGIDRIYVLTQYNSASLHRHIAQSYRFDVFSRGFVNILAAEQSVSNREWYQGTADAVRQNLERLIYKKPSEVLVLSGDQLYLMALRSFVEWHRANLADLTVAVKAVPREQAHAFGVMKVDSQGRIVDFVEKPQDAAQIDELVVPPDRLERLGFDPGPDQCLASMGIYAFRPAVLKSLLDGTKATDFGHEVIPSAVPDLRVFAFGYSGYWRDIGTIAAFHHANIELTQPVPPLDLYSPETPFYTHPRFLPGTKIDDCSVHHSVICEGSVVSGASISNSVIGIRSMIRQGTVIDRTVMMGANRYEWEPNESGAPVLGIGRNCTIRNA
ncbi:MAG: NTP transferase domain-containing protein, partial [Nitrospirae bacterium]|nr:NTP transferase domain-containing protein [Nitrospirota bacterium]